MDNQLLDSDFINQNKEGKSLNDILLNGYETHTSQYISKGYEIFKQNAGGFIGFIILAFFIRTIAAFIPAIGTVFSIILIPLYIGVNIVAKKIDQNEPYEFGNFFDGYKKMSPLIGAAFIQGLLAIAMMLIAFVPFFLSYGIDFFSTLENSSISDSRFMTLIITMVILIVLFIFIFVAWTLSSQLIVFNNNGAWQSMEISRKIVSKKYFNWLGFVILLALINFAGALCFLIGLLITIPTKLCAMYVAYEDVVSLNLTE